MSNQLFADTNCVNTREDRVKKEILSSEYYFATTPRFLPDPNPVYCGTLGFALNASFLLAVPLI